MLGTHDLYRFSVLVKHGLQIPLDPKPGFSIDSGCQNERSTALTSEDCPGGASWRSEFANRTKWLENQLEASNDFAETLLFSLTA